MLCRVSLLWYVLCFQLQSCRCRIDGKTTDLDISIKKLWLASWVSSTARAGWFWSPMRGKSQESTAVGWPPQFQTSSAKFQSGPHHKSNAWFGRADLQVLSSSYWVSTHRRISPWKTLEQVLFGQLFKEGGTSILKCSPSEPYIHIPNDSLYILLVDAQSWKNKRTSWMQECLCCWSGYKERVPSEQEYILTACLEKNIAYGKVNFSETKCHFFQASEVL